MIENSTRSESGSADNDLDEHERLARTTTTVDEELLKLRQTISYHEPHWNILTGVSAAVVVLVCLYYFFSEDLTYDDYKRRVERRRPTDGFEQQLEQDLFNFDQQIHDRTDNHSRLKLTSKLSGEYLSPGIDQRQLSFAFALRSQSDSFPPQNKSLSSLQRAQYLSKYRTDQYPELPFCLVVPTFNNTPQDRHLRNIRSIVQQEYQNYHLVVIDDASTDGTGEAILKFLREDSGLEEKRYTFVKNKERLSAMANLRRAASEFCKEGDIFMVVDGDDELIGLQVLKVFNSVFQQKKAWFVYSNSLLFDNRRGYSRPIPSQVIQGNNYRHYPFVTSHLRAFFTRLFLNIKEEDLKDESGTYLKSANDVAICIPVVEQSGQRVVYLPEVLYAYNGDTGLNNHKIRPREQLLNSASIRRKGKYAPLETLR